MDNDIKKPSNGTARQSEGATNNQGTAQGNNPEIKEGDGKKGRPEYGAYERTNTSSREDQLPSINDGGVASNDASTKNPAD